MSTFCEFAFWGLVIAGLLFPKRMFLRWLDNRHRHNWSDWTERIYSTRYIHSCWAQFRSCRVCGKEKARYF
jgi:hypothetical protein